MPRADPRSNWSRFKAIDKACHRPKARSGSATPGSPPGRSRASFALRAPEATGPAFTRAAASIPADRIAPAAPPATGATRRRSVMRIVRSAEAPIEAAWNLGKTDATTRPASARGRRRKRAGAETKEKKALAPSQSPRTRPEATSRRVLKEPRARQGTPCGATLEAEASCRHAYPPPRSTVNPERRGPFVVPGRGAGAGYDESCAAASPANGSMGSRARGDP